ncbi:MAG: class F sortase [bacterium]|nr:class F sortase [bacterium]
MKILLKQILLILASAGMVFSLMLLLYAIPESSASIIDNIGFGLLATPIGEPTRLKIPKINVDAFIEYVGVTSAGAMDISENQDSVAWFKLGPRPGEKGSAVIAGHYGIKNKKGSVFDGLYKLRKGDKIYIKDDKGATISFVVRKSQRYDPNADASDVFISNDGKAHLNLITCEGVWNALFKTYSKRLVVFTDKIIE